MNVKFLIEGMEEARSLALEELVRKEKSGFSSNVDYIVILEKLWISQRKPVLIYGTRGNSYFTVETPANRGRQGCGGVHAGILVGGWSRC